MICREMQRRANFDKGHFEYLLYLLNTITDQMDKEAKDAISVEEMDKLGVFGDLLYYYETTGFFTVRIADEIKDLSMLLKLSKKHREKLYEVLNKLHKQGCFELLTVHDCFYTKSNYCNYTRYWYKELLADLCQSTVLEFITEQLVPNNHQLHISQSQRNKIANLIRESEYGIC
jgi:RNAP2